LEVAVYLVYTGRRGHAAVDRELAPSGPVIRNQA
jgi:hypothetical protein